MQNSFIFFAAAASKVGGEKVRLTIPAGVAARGGAALGSRPKGRRANRNDGVPDTRWTEGVWGLGLTHP